ncbi:hypothetical protein HGM15179_002335, partial [Zosterops borbonicus]
MNYCKSNLFKTFLKFSKYQPTQENLNCRNHNSTMRYIKIHMTLNYSRCQCKNTSGEQGQDKKGLPQEHSPPSHRPALVWASPWTTAGSLHLCGPPCVAGAQLLHHGLHHKLQRNLSSNE